MTKLDVGPFKLTVDLRSGVVISRDAGTLSLAAANGKDLIDLMLWVMGVESMKVLPGRLSCGNFLCKFNKGKTKERTMEIRNTLKEEVGVTFTFLEGDKLIETIKAGLQIFVDSTTLQGPPRAHSNIESRDIAVDGR